MTTARLDGPSAAARIRVMKRDRFQCTYCGVPGTDAELEIDHIVPVVRGGSHHISNLTTACRSCNQTKGVQKMTPIAGGSHKPAGHPLIGKWFHSFKDADGETIQWQGQIIGIDDGKAVLQLYSWMDGCETEITAVDKSDLYDSTKFRLYSSDETMRDRSDMYHRKKYPDVFRG